MRKSNPFGWQLILGTGSVAVLCLWVPGSAVAGLVEAVPNLAVPATALGLTLITAANRDRL